MKNLYPLILASLACVASMQPAAAQDQAPVREFTQAVQPNGLTNYQFAVYYYNGVKTHNISGIDIADGTRVSQIKADPSGGAIAVAEEWRASQRLRLFDPFAHNKVLAKTAYTTPEVLAMAYSPDARSIAVLSSGKVDILSARDLTQKQQIETPLGEASGVAYSSGGRLLVVYGGSEVEVSSSLTGTLRRRLTLPAAVRSACFADDDQKLLVGTADGTLAVYDTRTWEQTSAASSLGGVWKLCPTPDGKYVAVLKNDRTVELVNLLNTRDTQTIAISGGGCTDIAFVADADGKLYLLHNTANAIVYRLLTTLSPYYSKMLATELNERLDLWRQRQDGETDAAYEQRVNETTIAEQIRLQEVEIATRRAEELGVMRQGEVTASGYSAQDEHLVLEFTNLPPITLDVPQDEVTAFADPGQLEFRNVQYALGADDQFEIVRAEVYNAATGKTYTYDNTAQQTASVVAASDMISLASYAAAQQEASAIRANAAEVMGQATAQSLITENTDIAVDTRPVSGYNAEGDRSTDYQATFTYTVRPGFAAREDFAPGHYHFSESGAAQATIDIIRQAVSGELAKYVKADRVLKIRITGAADALPVNSTIAYDEAYGTLSREPVMRNGQLVSLSLDKAAGISTNEQLALARAMGMKDALLRQLPALGSMHTEVEYAVVVNDTQVGGEHRRVSVQLTFVDALTK